MLNLYLSINKKDEGILLKLKKPNLVTSITQVGFKSTNYTCKTEQNVNKTGNYDPLL